MFAPLIQATKMKTDSRAVTTRALESPEVKDWTRDAKPARMARPTVREGMASGFTEIPVVAPDSPRQPGMMMPFVQAKLAVGPVTHPLEFQADLVADHVMRTPYRGRVSQDDEVTVRRECVGCDVGNEEQDESVEHEPIVLQSKPTRAPSGEPDIGLESAVRSLEGVGHPLPSTVRHYMEPRFGHDFSRVRVHADGRAASLARRANARAFTVGRNVVFAAGEYAPDSSAESRWLLAHELTHVIQQGNSHALKSSRTQGMTGLVQRPEERSRYEREHRAASGGLSPALEEVGDRIEPMIQRSATWKGATAVHETRSPAEMAIGGDSPVTWQQLNGTSLKTTADADSAIKVPNLTTTGSGTDWKAKVDTVPAQEGSDDETVLGPGPWTKVITKVAAGGVTGLPACTGAGNSTFSVHGKPSDDAVYKANRKHEDHHVADDKVAFDDEIGAWDKKVQEAKDKGTEFKGGSKADAIAALWTAMGNTPQNAARSYRTQSFAKGGAYHATATGGPMALSNPVANADCSTSALDVTNPA
jgi:hypothetical protein